MIKLHKKIKKIKRFALWIKKKLLNSLSFFNTTINERHIIINVLTKQFHNYLEIGIENGYTVSKTHFLHKVCVDHDPKFDTLDNVEIGKRVLNRVKEIFIEKGYCCRSHRSQN